MENSVLIFNANDKIKTNRANSSILFLLKKTETLPDFSITKISFLKKTFSSFFFNNFLFLNFIFNFSLFNSKFNCNHNYKLFHIYEKKKTLVVNVAKLLNR